MPILNKGLLVLLINNFLVGLRLHWLGSWLRTFDSSFCCFRLCCLKATLIKSVAWNMCCLGCSFGFACTPRLDWLRSVFRNSDTFCPCCPPDDSSSCSISSTCNCMDRILFQSPWDQPCIPCTFAAFWFWDSFGFKCIPSNVLRNRPWCSLRLPNGSCPVISYRSYFCPLGYQN